MDTLDWLAKWYLSMCDGEWEHSYGIRIDTLDNPGWSVQIDLSEGNIDEISFEAVSNCTDDSNWMHCEVKDGKFCGRGDPTKLDAIIEVFRSYCER